MSKLAIFVVLVCIVQKSNAVCTPEDVRIIVDELEDLYNTLDYTAQEGSVYAYHGYKHGEMFSDTLTWMLEHVFTEKHVSIDADLLSIAALYHDSGYPRSVTRKFVPGDTEKTYLARGHERESAWQLLDHLLIVQKMPGMETHSDCFQLKHIFPMLLLIQSTCVSDAIFGAGGQAAEYLDKTGKGLPKPEPEDDEAKEVQKQKYLKEKARVQSAIVAMQSCKVWSDWYAAHPEFKLSDPADSTFCEGANVAKPPLPQDVTTTLFHLARSDFGHLHQPGAVCWTADLLEEIFKECNGISCIVPEADDKYQENESPTSREARLTKFFFKGQKKFLGYTWVQWPQHMLDAKFKGKTRKDFYSLAVAQSEAISACLEEHTEDATAFAYLQTILGASPEDLKKPEFCPGLAALHTGDGPVCEYDAEYQAWMPPATPPTQATVLDESTDGETQAAVPTGRQLVTSKAAEDERTVSTTPED
eukprot:GILJ01001771.1.p1 GENE.GILJ01001771.1~~GILJ01001771.1.p1  ORF type:complete len:474 (+),score=70.70 GILJ01001771.1:61-1482(+)